MSSPCTGPRFIRCRVRDLASCFFACRLSSEEEPKTLRSKSPEASSGSIVLDSKGSGRGQKARAKTSSIAKKMGGDQSVQSSSYNSNGNGAQEDYIVFCFKEDGAIHMINEGKSSHENDDERDSITTTASAASTLSRKVYEKGSDKTDSERPHDDENKENISHVKQQNKNKMDSFESCDSNLSDTSINSFAFPVLGLEWTGSPVPMPKSRKRHDQSVCLDCCRF